MEAFRRLVTLSLDELALVTAWPGYALCRALFQGARNLLVAAPRRAHADEISKVVTTREELLCQLLGLLPSQFDMVLFRARIPPEYVAGSNAAQAMRALDAIRYLEQRGKLEQLVQALRPTTED